MKKSVDKLYKNIGLQKKIKSKKLQKNLENENITSSTCTHLVLVRIIFFLRYTLRNKRKYKKIRKKVENILTNIISI